MGRYDDMLDLPRPAMPRAKPLTGAERAAQFSPFAALAGYEAAIREAARLTEPAVELAEDAAAALDKKLRRSRGPAAYESIEAEIFQTLPLRTYATGPLI